MKIKIYLLFIFISASLSAQNKIVTEQVAFNYYRDALLKTTQKYNKFFLSSKLSKNQYANFSPKVLKSCNLKIEDTITSDLINITKEITISGNKKFTITDNFVNKYPKIEIYQATRFLNKNIVIIKEIYKFNQRIIYIVVNDKAAIDKYYEENL